MAKSAAALLVILMIAVLQVVSCTKPSGPETVPRMTVEQLKEQLDNPDLAIIDVRTGPDWKKSQVKIKGAVHEDPFKIGTWIDKYPKEKTLVIYCT